MTDGPLLKWYMAAQLRTVMRQLRERGTSLHGLYGSDLHLCSNVMCSRLFGNIRDKVPTQQRVTLTPWAALLPDPINALYLRSEGD